MKINLLNYFPENDTPRDSQITVFREIEKAIEDHVRFILIQAPTGSGKSYISAVLSNYSNPPNSEYANLVNTDEIFKKSQAGYIHTGILDDASPFGCVTLTVSKALQDQYRSLFGDSRVLKGRQNYLCELDDDFDCDFSPICLLSKKTREKCMTDRKCPYVNARRDVLVSKFGVYNYSAYLTLPDHVKRRQFIICDEASELEDELVKHFSCTIDYTHYPKITKLLTDDPTTAHKWLNDFILIVKDEYDESLEAIQNKRIPEMRRTKLLGRTKYLKNTLEKLIQILKVWYKSEYVIEFDAKRVTFMPLYVNILAQDFFKFGETVILMSGTIIDPKVFAKTLGIEEYKFIEVDSEFDPKASPIYCSDKICVNYENLDAVLPELIRKAALLCEAHKHEKGIIHTHNFRITKLLQQKFADNKRFLFREEGITNELLLKEHYERGDNTVIISPSLGFGTDLPDEFGRFQIIMKAPYLPLNSKRIKKLQQKNGKWYELRTLINLVQMCGRTTRSKDDHSVTYILDGQATNLIKRNYQKLPRWFLERIC